MKDQRFTPSRSVKPRKRTTNADRPIVVVIDQTACFESGEVVTLDELVTQLRTLDPHIVVSANESAALLRIITEKHGHNPNYNFRVTPIEREIFTGRENKRKLCLSLTSVSYFGWSKEKCGRNNSQRNRYHLLIDPLTFSNNWLQTRDFPTYLKWAQDIRAFCVNQGWNLRPTQGAVARQALQDSRFYPEARRKVPRSTNDRVRPQLPGNHYQLGPDVELHKQYEAEYLDQSRCHHNQAKSVKLPDANSLFGYGHYRDPEAATRPYRSSPERVASFIDGFMGMIYGTVNWPERTHSVTTFVPKCLSDWKADKPFYFYTEDLPLFESLSITVTSIYAAWGSKRQDTGLAKYAQWAIDELDGNGAPAWKKSLLLSPYGALATAPGAQTVGYHSSKGGERQTLRTRYGTALDVNIHVTSEVSEPSTNNVLHRALIESGNRTETLLYAHYLEQQGYRVLSVYVDALLVETQDELPNLFAPWRHDEHLTSLRYLAPSQFTSDQLRKLPGVRSLDRLKRANQLLGAGHRLSRMSRQDFAQVQLRAYVAGRPVPPSLPRNPPAG